MKYLGSVYFAIFLIAITLLIVIAGTFLESSSGSHLYASYFTYGTPFFQLLIALYFVNILAATLRRYPFQRGHIPFIITHIGLLMILTGLFCKSYFGLQGMMGITEGSGSDRIILANTQALLVEGRERRYLLPLKKEMRVEDLSFKIVEWADHAEERLEGFIKGEWGHVMGLPPLKIDGPPLQTTHYAIYVVHASPESLPFPGKASLFFALDEEEKCEHLVAFNAEGEKFTQTFRNSAFLVFDKGFGGYGVFAELPPHFPQMELVAPLTRVMTNLPPHAKREELTPRLRLLISDGERSEIATLTFDKYGTHFKWPALEGRTLLRFESLEQKIPFHIRLREGRQINYPGTSQPYSFEADLLIDGKEVTISMNRVFEKRGYRFYLANIATPPFGAKQVQIVVNHDPAKYYLTYPGAIILALGMILLYLRRLYV